MGLNVIYTGIFFDLTERRTEELLVKAGAKDMPQKFIERRPHVTLRFRPGADSEHVATLLKHEGERVVVSVVGVTESSGDDRKVAAFSVKLPDLDRFGLTCDNKIPHITVACAEGVSPVEANNASFTPLPSPFTLEGRLGYLGHNT